jgi:hypothetical protein
MGLNQGVKKIIIHEIINRNCSTPFGVGSPHIATPQVAPAV